MEKKQLTVVHNGSDILKDDQFYKKIIDLLPCYLSIQDRNLNIVYANRTFKKDFGDVTGRLCHLVYKDSEVKCRFCPVQKTFEDQKIHVSEETVKMLDGKICQMVVYSVPITDSSGCVDQVIEMSANISKVKEMQKELTALGSSIALVSHGIKNILEGLQGGAYVVDEGIKDRDMKLAEKGWDIVKKNIMDITDVAYNILYSSKNRPIKYQKISPNEIAKGSVDLFLEKAESMGVHLRHELNLTLPRVKMDAFSIRRMLNNLVWNALEACRKDKKKTSHAVIVRANFYDNHHFMFEVEDNGMGMDEAVQKNIFNEFYSTKGSGGTGLGLSVADEIIRKHDGRREVVSSPGKGATFRIIFSLKASPVEKSDQSARNVR